MAETTKIEWAEATISLWWGCTKVSPGCENCYALSWSRRWGKDIWGPGKPRERKVGAEKLARKLERQAAREGRTIRVFCASMSDWLDPEVPAEWLADLLALVRETPHLTWMLLTKRPHLWEERIRAASAADHERVAVRSMLREWLNGTPPANVWVGTTVEDQARADTRVPQLLDIPARVRFLSCEPLLGPVNLNLAAAMSRKWHPDPHLFSRRDDGTPVGHAVGLLDWIIAGGESGPGARPMHPAWARSLRDQATAAGVPFHLKQWGEWAPIVYATPDGRQLLNVGCDGKTETLVGTGADAVNMRRVGKAKAGRELDGRTWDEFPEARS